MAAPGAGRRRTPGLRREELAQLCDVSPTWLTWLEQGRPVSASAKMLARLAQVLQLSTAERAYLFEVADKHDPSHGTGEGGGPAAAELAAIVAAIDAPAYILDRAWNAVAWNDAATALFTGWLHGDGDTPNQLRFMFLDAGARALVVGWSERAQRQVTEEADGRKADVGGALHQGMQADIAAAAPQPFARHLRAMQAEVVAVPEQGDAAVAALMPMFFHDLPPSRVT